MYCGNCIRDNTLVTELRRLGHSTLMLPMYLPLTLDDANTSTGVPIFFSGINVYLEQRGALFRALPPGLHRFLAQPWLLRLVGKFAAKTRPAEVGDLTISMLQGEHGNQSRELDELVRWLKGQTRPDVVCLSNILLLGLARRLRQAIGSPVVCLLAGEDSFLDALPGPQRAEAWKILSDRTCDADLYLSPSRYFAERMAERLRLAPQRLRVVPPGINLAGFESPPARRPATPSPSAPPVVGYFARLCREKGLALLVEAFLLLKQRNRVPNLRLKIGGYCGPADRPFVRELHRRLRTAGVLGDVEFHANLDRAAKIAFLKSLTVFSVPASYGEAFGLYLIEALAAGVPVVQPRTAAFPEIIEATGGGLLCEPNDPESLADALESLLLDPTRLQALGNAGRQAAHERYSARRMAEETLRALSEVAHSRSPVASATASA
ncbi:MAG: glycosyltransferase family 4 protein [Verrucomicrobiales bacterium]|nr:glycosyltransferase family 4 protein [Verrucomicrobiales bacterium]